MARGQQWRRCFKPSPQPKNPPTAALVEGGHHASRLIERLDQTGWPVPDRISIMAISSWVKTKDMRPDLTCVLTSTHELILRAVQILHDQLESQSPRTAL